MGEDRQKLTSCGCRSEELDMCDIKIGKLITFIPTGIQVKVVSDDSIEYEDRIYKLSPFVGTFMPKNNGIFRELIRCEILFL